VNPSARGPEAPAFAEIGPGQLSCYTAALACYLEGLRPDPLAHIARSVRLAVRPGLPGGLIAFSHHGTALNDLADGSRLVYRSTADLAALPVALDIEMGAGLGVLAVTYTGSMPWSVAGSRDSAPHFLFVRARRAGRWQVEDPFHALLPSGSQEPFTGWITTAELTEAMTPPSLLRPEFRMRKEYVFGFPAPLPPDDHYQWLGRGAAPYFAPELSAGWLTEPDEALRFLSDMWAGRPDHQVPDLERYLDDLWAGARHHAFRYAHLSQLQLAPAELELVRAAHDLWQDLPMALHFAVASASRGRGRPSLIAATFDRLIDIETQAAGLLAGHGYGPSQPARLPHHTSHYG
jgi:hypothetical protein